MPPGGSLDAGSVELRVGARFEQKEFDKFDRAVERAEAQKAVETKLGGDFDPKAFVAYEKAMDETSAKAKRRDAFKAALGGDFDARAFNKMEREMAKARALAAKDVTAHLKADVDVRGFARFKRAIQDADTPIGALTRRLGQANTATTFLQRSMALLKWPALITGAGLAASAVGALTGGVVALVSALAPLSGAMAAFPAIGSAVVQGMTVAKLAIGGLKEALGGLNDPLDETSAKFKSLSPEAQSFARTLQGFKPKIRDLQQTAQKGLFPGAEAGLKSMMKNLPIVNKIVGSTSKALGGLARDAGKALGGKEWGKDLELQGGRNVRTIERLGKVGGSLANTFRHVMIAAGPLVDFLTRSAVAFSKNVEGAAKTGRETGKLQAFFQKTAQTMKLVAGIVKPLAAAFWEIGKAAAPLGRTILKDLGGAADKFEQWTKSARGKNDIADFFKGIKAPLYAVAGLVGDVVKMFARLSSSGEGRKGFMLVIDALRKDLLPVLEKVIAGTTAAFGPAFIKLVTNVLRVFGAIAGSSGPLVIFVKLLGGAAGWLAKLLEKNPGLQSMVVSFAGLAAVIKTISFLKMISGFNQVKTAAVSALGYIAKTRAGETMLGAISFDLKRGAGKVKELITKLFARRAAETTAADVGGDAAGGLLTSIRGKLRKGADTIGALLKRLFARRATVGVAESAGADAGGGLISSLGGHIRKGTGKIWDLLKRLFRKQVATSAVGGFTGAAAGELMPGLKNKMAGPFTKFGTWASSRFGALGALSGTAFGVAAAAALVIAVATLGVLVAKALDNLRKNKIDPWIKKNIPGGSSINDIANFIGKHSDNPITKMMFGGAEGGLVTSRGIVRGYASGGPVLDPRDTIPAMLRKNEFVVTPEGTQAAGVAALTALNQGKPTGMAKGGKAEALPGLAKSAAEEQKKLEGPIKKIRDALGSVATAGLKHSRKTRDDVRKELETGGTEWHKKVKEAGDKIEARFVDMRKGGSSEVKKLAVAVTDRLNKVKTDASNLGLKMANSVTGRFADMKTGSGKQLRALHVNVKDRFEGIRSDANAKARKMESNVGGHFGGMRATAGKHLRAIHSGTNSDLGATATAASKQGKKIRDGVAKSYESMDKAVQTGIGYVQTATNNALKGLGGKSVSFDVPKPKGLASGRPSYMVDAPSRHDSAMFMLGADEAVVNVPDQRVLNGMLTQAYGMELNDVIGITGRMNYAASGKAGSSTVPADLRYAAAGKPGGSHLSRLIAAANKVNAANFPYQLGGGHENPANFEPFDCSGAVSYATQQAGYRVPTTVSGDMGSWGFPGGTGEATIFYNSGHTFMRIGNRYFGTSGFARPNGGAGWFTQSPGAGYLSGFKTAHLTNLGDAGGMVPSGGAGGGVADQVPEIKVKGSGPLAEIAQRSIAKVRGAANSKIDKVFAAMNPGGGQSLEGFKGGGNTGQNRQLGKRMADAFAGWGHGKQWSDLDWIWTQESGWDEHAAYNKGDPYNHAYGIPQSNPGTKMASAGPKWKDDAATQIKWGLGYIKGTYGDPIRTAIHKHAVGTYAAGRKGIGGFARRAARGKGAAAGKQGGYDAKWWQRMLGTEQRELNTWKGAPATIGNVKPVARLMTDIEQIKAVLAHHKNVGLKNLTGGKIGFAAAGKKGASKKKPPKVSGGVNAWSNDLKATLKGVSGDWGLDSINSYLSNRQDDYDFEERRYNVEVGIEEFVIPPVIDEKTGLVVEHAKIDKAALNKKMESLNRLVAIREDMVAKIRTAISVVQNTIGLIRDALTRLRAARSRAKHKDRPAYNALIGWYKGQGDSMHAAGAEYHKMERNADLDAKEITNERSAFAPGVNAALDSATKDEPQPELPEPADPGVDAGGDTTGGDTGTGTGDTGTGIDPAEVAAQARAMFQAFTQQRQSLFASFGSNFYTDSPGGDVGTVAAGLRNFGAFGQVAGKSAAGGAYDPTGLSGGAPTRPEVHITNHYAAPPPDPHTYTAQTVHEIRAQL